MSQYFRQFLLISFFTLIGFSQAAATPPTDSAGRCNFIHEYEALCNNKRPGPCYSSGAINYSGNAEHRRIIDDYYTLCVQSSTPFQERHSNECIQYLGIQDSCEATVRPPLELVPATIAVSTGMVIEERHVAVTNPAIAACFLLVESRDKIDRFFESCGNVTANNCSATTEIKNAYRTVCNESNPCDCFASMHCRADYCETPVSAGGPVLPAPGGTISPIAPGAPASGGVVNTGANGEDAFFAAKHIPASAPSVEENPSANPASGGGSCQMVKASTVPFNPTWVFACLPIFFGLIRRAALRP